ncbi:hypothetical protein Tco_1380088, partial [Tanacetum coccineum]
MVVALTRTHPRGWSGGGGRRGGGGFRLVMKVTIGLRIGDDAMVGWVASAVGDSHGSDGGGMLVLATMGWRWG